MKVKEESEKVGLKLNIQKIKIMASGPITSWEIDGEIVETVSNFIFEGSKITADGDCSYEIKRRLLLEGKVMTNLVQFSSVQLLSRVQLFILPLTAANQASRSLLKLMPIKLVMSSKHLILCRPLLLPPSIFPNIRLFSSESVLPIRKSIRVSASASVLPVNIQD